jgi:succinate dehydrogenase / fumarate reductase membrane anchor subunit
MTDVPQKVIAEPTTHYGSARRATRDFRLQRLTAAFNVFFLVVIVWFVITSAGAGHGEMVATVRNPVVALVLALLVVNVPVHMRIGMQEIIEDYVHEPRLHRFCRMLNTYFAIVIGLVGLAAVGKIFFWG